MTKINPPTLPVHPYSGLRALAVLPSGRPVWPVLGGNGEGGAGDGGAGTGASGGAGEGGQSGEGGQGGQTFSQADVDRIVGERLARERGKFGDYDALKAKADELDKLKEASASDTEKAVNQARKDTEAAIRGQLEPEMNKIQAAIKHGLPDDLGAKLLSAAKRLVGTTAEELEADAAEFFATSPLVTNGAANGGGGFDQGTRSKSGSDKPTLSSGADLYNQRHSRKT